ncbi:MAG: glycosyltransferase family 2 protein, partial [Fimbriimonadaceae bacterium]|nr:glycosyltransferase family 2 protein [Chitinophagales bacterium]
MHTVTAIITCRNESHNIEAALQSVGWCDEILVIDAFSTDDTVEKAKKYTTKILQHEYLSPALQKNWAIPQASYAWILILDSDERITAELKNEIQNILQQEKIGFEAFWIYRKNYFLGKEIKYSGWQRDKVIRLFKRDICRYEEKQVHEEIVTKGAIGKLKNKMLHYTYKDIFHYLEKWDRYSTWGAQDAAKKNKRPTLFHFVIKPAFRFFKHYIIDLGFLDGIAGFIICSLAAVGVFMRYAKLY